MMRSAVALAALTFLASCAQSEQDRVHAARERAAASASVTRSEVVQSSRSPREPGRVIYDKPIDLSYTTLRQKRPDLDSAAHGAKPARAKMPRPARASGTDR